MSYELHLRRAVQKQLDDLPQPDFEAMANAISALTEEPRPSRVKKLADSSLWRVRVGRYRVVFAIDDKNQMVTVVRVARRREDTYRGLE